MQGNETERRREPRRQAERNAAQPLGTQPRDEDDEDGELRDPDTVPSYLTARELQAWDPATTEDRRGAADRRIPRDDLKVRRIVHDDGES
jgi:hypothetical protein